MTIPPGWYPDPGHAGGGPVPERWWDGSEWTVLTRDSYAPVAPPPVPRGLGLPTPVEPSGSASPGPSPYDLSLFDSSPPGWYGSGPAAPGATGTFVAAPPPGEEPSVFAPRPSRALVPGRYGTGLPVPAGPSPSSSAPPPSHRGERAGGRRRGARIAAVAVVAGTLAAAVAGGFALLDDGGGDDRAGPGPGESSGPSAPDGGPPGDGGAGGDPGGTASPSPGDGTRTVADPLNGIALPLPRGWKESRADGGGTALTTGRYPCPGDPAENCVRGGVLSRMATGYEADTPRGVAEEDIARNAEQAYGKDLVTGRELYGGITSQRRLDSGKVTVAGQEGYLVRWRVVTRKGDDGIVQSLAFPSPSGSGPLVVVRFAFDDSDEAPPVAELDRIVKGIAPLEPSDGPSSGGSPGGPSSGGDTAGRA